MVGKIQKYDELRGYGFILRNFRDRIFFHLHQWQSDKPPVVGMVVTYDLIPAGKAGFEHQAGNVRPFETGLNAAESDAFVTALNSGGAQ